MSYLNYCSLIWQTDDADVCDTIGSLFNTLTPILFLEMILQTERDLFTFSARFFCLSAA